MKIKEEIKELWKLCFNDSDEFVEMYFRLRYSSDTTMYIQSGNIIVSSLQMPYYPMTFEGTEIQTAYISGACTHPDFRGKGVMAQLLAESFSRMVHKNIPLSILIPANPGLYDYYAKTGYARAFFRTQIEQNAADIAITKGNLRFEHISTFDKRIFEYFTKKAYNRPNYVQHTATDFEAVMEDLRMGEGTVTIAHRPDNQVSMRNIANNDSYDKIVGILFSYPEENHLKAPEWFADNDSIRDNMLREAAHHHQRSKIIRFELPNYSLHEEPFGMARIINAKMMLGLYAAAHPEKMINIHLTDDQLTFNNGYYYICDGICTFSPNSSKSEHLELNAHEFNTLIFNDVRLYMSLMLE